MNRNMVGPILSRRSVGALFGGRAFNRQDLTGAVELGYPVVQQTDRHGRGSLSIIGVGVPVGDAAWGSMLVEAFDDVHRDFWNMFFPGLAIAVTVPSFNLLGDGLRESAADRLAEFRYPSPAVGQLAQTRQIDFGASYHVDGQRAPEFGHEECERYLVRGGGAELKVLGE